ncbi:hypothetical protein BCR36DRAFT_585276 [Piromyces finnis]|uniref:Ankyrin n=1 Tax=Piromyces finnis TaxID=1754191 RepID=A0A1Y1V4K1_9FUNG|nr:hypothetical protein BCR36DRAFT_585276 [Piromyces finnis]|eukprot:ORX46461.1 hypothetical protein BCR36DRAFT_585276 [Piromyces finnis]
MYGNDKDILEIIKRNDITLLQQFILENNISLNDIDNYNSFHILAYAIEQNVSIDIIQIIIKQCEGKNISYYENEFYIGIQDSPLFMAISKNNFRVASLLIKRNLDIFSDNFEFILNYLLEYNLLNKKNLKYLLTVVSDANIWDNFILELILSSIDKNTKQIVGFLKIIFNYYIFNNTFILKLLTIYKNKRSLTTSQLSSIITSNNNRVTVRDNYYKEAICYGAESLIEILLKYDKREHNILLKKINEYKKIETIMEDGLKDERLFYEELLGGRMNFF